MRIGRRDFIAASGALAMSTTIGAEELSRMTDTDFSSDYALSSRNPLATRDQRMVEDRALRLIDHPLMRRSREETSRMLRMVMAADVGDAISEFDAFIDEYIFHYTMRAANNDPDYPTVMRFMTQPHHWFGRDVPGSRWAGDSPDFIYRVITTSHGPRYVIKGRATSKVRPTVTYSLLADRQATSFVHSTLNSVAMDIGPDGEFTITMDPSPANGRPNHIQTQPDCYAVWVRDALGDWSECSANLLRVYNLDEPAGEPKSDDELALWGANAARDGLYYLYWLTRTSWLQVPNQPREPRTLLDMGGMPGQWGAGFRLALKPDEAFIVTCNAGGAQFRNTQLTDFYWLTWDYWNRQTSLNAGQMAPNEDGTFTYVYAHEDPGVHNWVDLCGRADVRVGHRWQSFRNGEPDEPLFFNGKLVRFSDVERELPDGVPRIDAAGRKQQLARRKEGFDRRFIDS